MVLKRNPPGYFMCLYMKIWPDAYFYMWNFEKKIKQCIWNPQIKIFIFLYKQKFCYKDTHPLPSTGLTNIKFDVQKDYCYKFQAETFG